MRADTAGRARFDIILSDGEGCQPLARLGLYAPPTPFGAPEAVQGATPFGAPEGVRAARTQGAPEGVPEG